MSSRDSGARHGSVFSEVGNIPSSTDRIHTDVKATALLKLIYLEMFGHDMSWASFHVLEVMSSAKYLQKRVGYLGAVQSFRQDTEVLMLATNLLKKVS
jgi:AP-3 complex subunit delta-1